MGTLDLIDYCNVLSEINGFSFISAPFAFLFPCNIFSRVYVVSFQHKSIRNLYIRRRYATVCTFPSWLFVLQCLMWWFHVCLCLVYACVWQWVWQTRVWCEIQYPLLLSTVFGDKVSYWTWSSAYRGELPQSNLL